MRKVVPGQPISFPARDWNRLADIANPNALGQSTGQSDSISSDVVYVKNSLGRDLARYAAVCIGAPDLPTGLNDQIYPLLNPSLQNLRSNTGRALIVGILQEPIANGRTGRAQIRGATPARFREPENIVSFSPVCYADMSDRDDMLVASSMGPISVLSTGTVTGNSNRLWMVELGRPVSLATAAIAFNVGSWNSQPSYLYSYGTDLTYSWQFGDGIRLGLFHTASTGVLTFIPAGDLFIARNGRYLVTVQWGVSPKISNASPSSGDSYEYIVNWGGSIAEFGSVSYNAWTSEMGALGLTYSISGERSFFYGDQNFNFNSSGAHPIWIPGVTVKRLNSSGVVQATLALQGAGTIHVAYFGPITRNNGMWTPTQKSEVWGRSTSAGPIP